MAVRRSLDGAQITLREAGRALSCPGRAISLTIRARLAGPRPQKVWQDRDVPGRDLSQLAQDVDARCRLGGTFTLRSGQVSEEYFDKYLFESDPVLLQRVAGQMTALVPPGTSFLAGLELGGVPLATVLSQATGIPALFVRKQAKGYGTRRLAEGGDPAGCTVTLVEDVITTGGAVAAAARALRELGATVTTVLCAIDRAGPEVSVLVAEGIAVRSVLTKDLLDSLSQAT
jgi:orotate phosphoribosyltransferase